MGRREQTLSDIHRDINTKGGDPILAAGACGDYSTDTNGLPEISESRTSQAVQISRSLVQFQPVAARGCQL